MFVSNRADGLSPEVGLDHVHCGSRRSPDGERNDYGAGFSGPHFGALRQRGVVVAQRGRCNVLRCLFDSGGRATPNGTITGLSAAARGAVAHRPPGPQRGRRTRTHCSPDRRTAPGAVGGRLRHVAIVLYVALRSSQC
jgi:hypothetical protein